MRLKISEILLLKQKTLSASRDIWHDNSDSFTNAFPESALPFTSGTEKRIGERRDSSASVILDNCEIASERELNATSEGRGSTEICLSRNSALGVSNVPVSPIIYRSFQCVFLPHFTTPERLCHPVKTHWGGAFLTSFLTNS